MTQPIAVRDTTAAKMLDLPATVFRKLVNEGALPPPCNLGGHVRWRVSDIQAILDGQASRPDEEFEL
ncbi:helix-turn-helix transcriptional regulator [Pseudosulfitobacter pseudonitzschiae]|uniref:helix-turn-helix transcriptional regulator n=1 Tax=Pseudosulfitobacter pseudonitzschiae TaxID=1402135 RepID=UPI001AF834E4|nr:helix-turn-helix domain-containing protein [Pseudosulfitobacter pseudonitzschiae]MBM1813443.1 helix-turn-helix domain-containing protein [Pseudosulfitobacter pseudonitzschiae]MBM1830436.1 helix-turn-helix domain-containing protein [Pseudosulfitobacter pseudonitzschiae]MBM1835303.1 helix-turn-helix domain-containing protein [Pseudosulfitobacter pseudonitzschiae]MBM1840149.1 helix-turn-helix domain-containing protein [Pseudosulfitobacter pseudonitzschiae]MBM1845863.1 helix-turn-helix domain-c